MKWILEKYLDDSAIYARCDNCGWEYNCSSFNANNFEVYVSMTHPYCAECGMKAENHQQKEYNVSWNKREKNW